MINLKNDYNTIAHPRILEAMSKCNENRYVGYGLDEVSESAKKEIKKYIDKDVDIHFLVGGTSTNKIVISHSLRPHQAVISVKTGHICVHETGAIESTGHRIIEVEGVDGKITPSEIIKVMKTHTDEHMVEPRMVYISQSTELGTCYTLGELMEIYDVCNMYDLYLFIDGARLGVALDKTGLSLNDMANCCDVFYIGGTKNGAMLGEAVVISNPLLKKDFRYSIKQNGGMYAKGFVAGIQFYELFKDGLYFDLARRANHMADYLSVTLYSCGITTINPNYTNQIFVEVNEETFDRLSGIVLFEIWEDKGQTKVLRFVTSYATTKKELNDLYSYLS